MSIYGERKKQMVLEIGRTCYTVNLILKESGKKTYKDKVFRLLEQDIENKQEKNFEEIWIMTWTNLPKCEHIAVPNENIYLKIYKWIPYR